MKVKREQRRGPAVRGRTPLSNAQWRALAEAQQYMCHCCFDLIDGDALTINGFHPWYHPRTGKVRRLVCYHCWAALQHLGDDPDLAKLLGEFLVRTLR